MMDKILKAMADGGEFDATEGMRAIARKLLDVEGRLDGRPAKPAPDATLKGRENGTSGGEK